MQEHFGLWFHKLIAQAQQSLCNLTNILPRDLQILWLEIPEGGFLQMHQQLLRELFFETGAPELYVLYQKTMRESQSDG